MISSRICKICILREEVVGANQDKDTMAEATTALRRKPISSFKKWFLGGRLNRTRRAGPPFTSAGDFDATRSQCIVCQRPQALARGLN